MSPTEQMRYQLMAKIFLDDIDQKIGGFRVLLQIIGKSFASTIVVFKTVLFSKFITIPGVDLKMFRCQKQQGSVENGQVHIFIPLMMSYIGDSTDSITQPSIAPRMMVMDGSIIIWSFLIASLMSRS